ncbi:excisionase family DNA binding protein [Nocardiopsis sp. Huas11]|nr:excisionase family DNA binding protein [Nocardiopsis sp. Huas11]
MAVARNVTIDQEADAGYLQLMDAAVARSADYGSFVIDLSADGQAVGVEVLTLERPLDTPGVLEALEETGSAPDSDTHQWARSFATQISDLHDSVEPPLPARPTQESKPPLEEVRFLTVAEVASIMRVSKMTVYRMVHSGVLPAIRVGRSYRVPDRAVQDYLRESAASLWALG